MKITNKKYPNYDGHQCVIVDDKNKLDITDCDEIPIMLKDKFKISVMGTDQLGMSRPFYKSVIILNKEDALVLAGLLVDFCIKGK